MEEKVKTKLGMAYPGILKKYLKIAREYAKKDTKVLKTDAFNEVRDIPEKGGIAGNIEGLVHLIEWKTIRTELALEKGFDCTRGDIRDLPFNNNEFDLILDFSTIDHVRYWNEVLPEYRRVMVPGGLVSIVFWARPVFEYINKQYYFPREIFIRDFSARFKVKEMEVLYHDIVNTRERELIWILGEKPGGKKKEKKITSKKKVKKPLKAKEAEIEKGEICVDPESTLSGDLVGENLPETVTNEEKTEKKDV